MLCLGSEASNSERMKRVSYVGYKMLDQPLKVTFYESFITTILAIP